MKLLAFALAIGATFAVVPARDAAAERRVDPCAWRAPPAEPPVTSWQDPRRKWRWTV